MHNFTLHRASWVVPVSAPAIENGAVLVDGDKVAAVGACTDLRGLCPPGTKVRDHGAAALIPALVNAHTHLELSFLQGTVPLPCTSFADWLEHLFSKRASVGAGAQKEALNRAKRELFATGTGLVADITNGAFLDSEAEAGQETGAERLVFFEVLGFDLKDIEKAVVPELWAGFSEAAERSSSFSLAAHSCYSTSPELIRAAKDWCRGRGRVFSIHVAEHPEEMEFLREGKGFCRNLLERLGRWAPRWAPPRSSPVQYLDSLGVLDAETLLVHAVHMSEHDWELLARRSCSVCFCPRSNTNVNGGRVDPGWALDAGLTVALGTDSLASNTDLNLFSEAAAMLNANPGLPPERVLSMMTAGGAGALAREDLGSIEPGKRAALLAVFLPDSISASHLLETLIHQGARGACQWASYPRNH